MKQGFHVDPDGTLYYGLHNIGTIALTGDRTTSRGERRLEFQVQGRWVEHEVDQGDHTDVVTTLHSTIAAAGVRETYVSLQQQQT